MIKAPITWVLAWQDFLLWWDQAVALRAAGKWDRLLIRLGLREGY